MTQAAYAPSMQGRGRTLLVLGFGLLAAGTFLLTRPSDPPQRADAQHHGAADAGGDAARDGRRPVAGPEAFDGPVVPWREALESKRIDVTREGTTLRVTSTATETFALCIGTEREGPARFRHTVWLEPGAVATLPIPRDEPGRWTSFQLEKAGAVRPPSPSSWVAFKNAVRRLGTGRHLTAKEVAELVVVERPDETPAARERRLLRIAQVIQHLDQILNEGLAAKQRGDWAAAAQLYRDGWAITRWWGDLTPLAATAQQLEDLATEAEAEVAARHPTAPPKGAKPRSPPRKEKRRDVPPSVWMKFEMRKGEPFRAAVARLETSRHVSVAVTERARAKAGGALRDVASFVGPPDEILDVVAEAFALRWTRGSDGRVWFDTEPAKEDRPILQFYDVSDLIVPEDPKDMDARAALSDSLARALQLTVEPDKWDYLPGLTIQHKNRVLVVAAPKEMHDQISQFMDDYRSRPAAVEEIREALAEAKPADEAERAFLERELGKKLPPASTGAHCPSAPATRIWVAPNSKE